MKKKLLIASSIATLIVLGLVLQTNFNSKSEIELLREKHASHLENSPFKETLKLTKAERKAKGIPPNKYFEQMFELTMDPSTGRPHPERVLALQETLYDQFSRVPGENSNSWEERGPDNVGGRTRAIMFDPNDGTNKRVFAGGVSGGLWVNDDITDGASAWAEVNIPQNLGISCIAYDPNDTQTFYVGTGESYVFGDVNGNGVWKSTDGGANWTQVFGGQTGVTPGTLSVLTVNSPGSIAGDYDFVPAGFGPAIGSFSGNLVLASTASGVPTEACTALNNAGAINGNIAVIERGNCEFGTKVLNAENAGAVAVIVINNVAGAPISMGAGAVGDTVTIPSFMISQADGAGILTELGNSNTVNVSVVGGTGTFVTGISHINDIAIRDVGEGVSEVFVGASDSAFRYSLGAPGETPVTGFGIDEFGLFRSSDGGANWTQIDLEIGRDNPYMPNDIEIAADNKVWVSTTNSSTYGDGGGRILSSSDGINFSLRQTIPNADRTQIAVSGTSSGTVYVLAELTAGAPLELMKTTDEFANETSLTQPTPVDTGQPSDDFTRGQAFYDLLLEVDPTDDGKVYVGGIDLYRTNDSAANWSQISKWSNNNALAGLNVSLVHADQHTLVFDPSDPTKGVVCNDGGVYYLINSGGLISSRNKNYNTLQFYKGAIGPEVGDEKFLAGAQDNGSQLINSASAGIGGSNEIRGGDGAYVFIDKDRGYMIASYVYNSFSYHNYNTGGASYTIVSDTGSGQFINPAALDSDNNILYTDGSGQINRYTLGTSSATPAALTNALLTSTPTAFKPSTFTTTTLFVGTSGGELLKLTNANASPSWSDISGPDFLGSISCIELGETENDIYVTFYNYGVTSVFFSDDGGATWSNKEGNLPDMPTRAILANPLNYDEVIVGTELGVWATNNFSAATPTWYQSQDGMKDVKVTSFDMRTSDYTVLASTYGRGMFTGTFDNTASGLSVDEFAQNNLIKIYPTVSNGEITIAPTSEVRVGALNIFDVNGREVHASNLDFATGANQQLSLNLASGVYIVKFTANNVQSTQKIIIE
ncbi:MAG: T9SS type A sorting domain-containing protein [Urechidicola sp.]|nr:T9SS type A sorting domain-containing protein [Urechidicola sp.]